MADIRRATHLVGNDTHLVLLLREREHRAHEVAARPAKEPGRPDDPALADLLFSCQLRPSVCRKRIRLVGFHIRLSLATVEDIVGREVNDRRVESDDVPRPPHVDQLGQVRSFLRAVDVCPCRGVENEIGPVVESRRRDVEGLPHAGVGIWERLGERGAELAAGPCDQDTATDASRPERIGDCVLQRCLTRRSFHGTTCSSGWWASYSCVTR